MIEPTTLAQQGLRKATADVSTYSIFSARAGDDDKDSLDGLDRHYDDEYGHHLVPHHRASEDTESTLLGGTDDSTARRRGGGGGGGAGGAEERLLGGGGAAGLLGWRRNTPLGPMWLWMLHAAMLTVSVLLFAISATVEPATRAYVEKFNAWCKLGLLSPYSSHVKRSQRESGDFSRRMRTHWMLTNTPLQHLLCRR